MVFDLFVLYYICAVVLVHYCICGVFCFYYICIFLYLYRILFVLYCICLLLFVMYYIYCTVFVLHYIISKERIVKKFYCSKKFPVSHYHYLCHHHHHHIRFNVSFPCMPNTFSLASFPLIHISSSYFTPDFLRLTPTNLELSMFTLAETVFHFFLDYQTLIIFYSTNVPLWYSITVHS